MDRVIVYPGAPPIVEDILNLQRNAMVAVGYLTQATLGTGTVADGLACGPVAPPNMSLEVGPGSLTSFGVVDGNAYSTLPASLNPLMKMGIATGYTTLGFVAPPVPGQSIDYLIQAQAEETDGNPVVLPYYNAANPSQPYAGPGGGGAAQVTLRQQVIALQLKAGLPAVSGSQVAPVADAGWTPLYIVTVPAGATQLTQANISLAAGAPFIGAKIPQLDAAVAALQGGLGAAQAATGSEAARAEAEEAVLNAAIGAEVTRAEAAEANLNTEINSAVAAETQRAEAAEANLNNAIIAEAGARNSEVGTEATNRNNADVAEANARAAGDAAVSASIPGAIAGSFSGSAGGTGWRRSADGYIEQWGNGVNGNGILDISFPVTFPNELEIIETTEGDASGWLAGGTLNPTSHGPANRTNSGFTMVSITTLSNGATQYAAGASFNWRATGR